MSMVFSVFGEFPKGKAAPRGAAFRYGRNQSMGPLSKRQKLLFPQCGHLKRRSSFTWMENMALYHLGEKDRLHAGQIYFFAAM